jgi:hypothetical protein
LLPSRKARDVMDKESRGSYEPGMPTVDQPGPGRTKHLPLR